MGIQFGGLASGLDTNAIIGALVALQSRPITLLQNQRSQQSEKLSKVGELETLLKKLEDKAQELTALGGFFSYGVETADESVAEVVASGSVATGSHTIAVTSLASAARYTFDTATTVTDASEGLFGAGTLSFDYDGETYQVTVEDGASLDDIAAAITSAAGEAVSASVVNVGTSSSPEYHLVVAGRDTGADFDLENIATSGDLDLGSVRNLTEASDAVATIDGLEVTRSTNVFDDVLEGLTITALAENETTSFTVSLDAEETRSVLKGFVDAYNAVVTFAGKQNSFSEDSGPGGPLFGDNLLRRVTSSLRRALFDPDLTTVASDTTGYSTLGLIGVDLGSDGTLSIDEDELEAKLTADPDAFEALFTGDDEGVLVKLGEEIDGLLDGFTVSGSELKFDSLFTSRRTAINSVIKSIDSQVEQLQRNLERFEESLVQRFANLESIIGGLNSQSAYLASNPLAGLNSR